MVVTPVGLQLVVIIYSSLGLVGLVAVADVGLALFHVSSTYSRLSGRKPFSSFITGNTFTLISRN